MGIFRKLEDWFAAVAFAEAGEFDTAREMMKPDEPAPPVKTARPKQGAESRGQAIAAPKA